MLVRFNVKNFLSFYEREDPETHKIMSHEFSMIPGKVRLNPEHVYENKKQNEKHIFSEQFCKKTKNIFLQTKKDE